MNKIMKKASWLMLSLALSAQAYAAPDLTGWTLIADNGTRFYMSPEHMTQVGHKQVEAWEIRTEFLQQLAPFPALEKIYEEALYLYDCQNHSVGLRQLITHYASGRTVNGGRIADEALIMKAKIPNSIDEAQLNYACRQFGW